MRKKLFLTLLVPVLAFSSNAAAQSLQTGFFLDNYVYSYQLNPASAPDSTKFFLGLGIDNVSVGVNSNMGLKSLVFPVNVNGQKSLVTGLNSAVDAKTFLGGLKNVLRLDADISENILSFGFAKNKSFFTFEANVKGLVSSRTPKDFLALLKQGTNEQGVYAIKNLSENLTTYAEVAMGYSYKVNDNLSVGGRLKVLAGLADLSVNVNNIQATVRDDIALDGNGSLTAHVLAQDIPVSADGSLALSDLEIDSPGIGGFGAALDMGAEYRLPSVEALTLSASVADLGGIFWKNGYKGVAKYNGVIDGESEPVGFEDMFKVESAGTNDFIGVSPRFNVGARYQIARMLSVGALATVRAGRFGWSEARLGTTFTPGKIFSLAASAGVSTYGASVGCAFSFKVPGFDLYLGTDSIVASFTPEYIPVNKVHTRLNFGLVLAF